MKIGATGDQHLGAGADLGLKPGDRLREQEHVWAWTLQQFREHEVDAILHAGDVFHHRKPDPETMLAFERPLIEHADKDYWPPLVIPGNHDLSSLDGGCALDVFHEAGLIELVREPRVVLTEGGARVCALPWAPVARLAANFDGPRDLLNEHAASLLVDVARDLHDAARASELGPDGSGPLILLTHFAISGTSLPSGLPVDQLREPVLPQDELLAIGYDAIVAGHIHRRQHIGLETNETLAFYVGSPQPLNFGEDDGIARGPWIIDFAADSWRTRELLAPSRPFVTVTEDDFETRSVEGAFVKLRVRADAVHEIRESVIERGAYRVFVETIVERETRARDRTVDDSLDEREALRRWLEAQDLDPETVASALARAAGYLDRAQSGGFAAPTPEPLIGAVA